MADESEKRDALDRLAAATQRYEETKAAHEDAAAEVAAALVDALKADVTPTAAADASPFTATYVRKLARDAGVPPAKPGKKPGTKRAAKTPRSGSQSARMSAT